MSRPRNPRSQGCREHPPPPSPSISNSNTTAHLSASGADSLPTTTAMSWSPARSHRIPPPPLPQKHPPPPSRGPVLPPLSKECPPPASLILTSSNEEYVLYPFFKINAPKRYDPFDTARDLEPFQSNVGYIEEKLQPHPSHIDRNLTDPFSTQTTTAFNPPPPRRRPGEAKAPAGQHTPWRADLWDALDREDALKSSSMERDKSDEQLEESRSWSAESKMYNTWQHYLQDLKPAWNGNRRLAIDVPGDGMEILRAANSFGANEAETRLVCDLVKGALEAEVPANGVAPTCANFLGVVVHGAGGGVITEKGFRFRINKPGKRVMVEHTSAIEDAEGDILLMCFARNIRDKQFDVTLSRAKQSTVVIGNVRAWCQERIDDSRRNTAFGKKVKLNHFSSYVQSIIEENDGVSYGDIQRFLNGEEILEAEFPKLFKPKLDATRSMERDMATAELKGFFARLEQESGDKNKAKKKKTKKTRRSSPTGADHQKEQEDFRKSGDHGGAAAGESTVIDHIPVPTSRKDDNKNATTFQPTPSNSASEIPLLCYSIDALAELNPLRTKLANGDLLDQSLSDHTMQPIDQDAFYYDTQTSELRSKHGASTQVLPVSDIPDDLRFRELAKGKEYDEAFDNITKRYNGVDGLTKEEAIHPNKKKFFITRKPAAIVSFDSEARAATGTAPATHGPYFGQGLKTDQGIPKPWIKLEYVMYSQHPAIALVLQEEGQNDVTCYFYANSIQRDLEKDEVKFQIHGNNEAGGRHEHIREVADLRKSCDLVQVEVYPWGPDKVMLNDNGIRPTKAVFTGITNARISELVEFADGNHPEEWEALSARDKVIVFLYHSRHFSVFQYWPSGGDAPVDKLREWMRTAMLATAKHGFHWFYQVQSDIHIDATKFPLEDTTVPRWLAKTMIVEFDHEGKLVTMRPHEWNPLSVANERVSPTAMAGAFALRLAIVRAGNANQQ